MKKKWFVYLIKCSDESLYCGIAIDVEKRIKAHVHGVGAKYTRGKGPFILLYSEECEDHKAAAQREVEIKGWSREKKLNLLKSKSKTK